MVCSLIGVSCAVVGDRGLGVTVRTYNTHTHTAQNHMPEASQATYTCHVPQQRRDAYSDA